MTITIRAVKTSEGVRLDYTPMETHKYVYISALPFIGSLLKDSPIGTDISIEVTIPDTES
jgi:hypothetical protein